MNDFLLQFDKLYHFSPEVNRKSILDQGILPSRDRYQDSDFHPATSGDNRAMVCFCRSDQIASYIDTQRGYNPVDPIVCEIDTIVLAKLRIGLDWTMQGTIDLFMDENIPPFVEVTVEEQEAIALLSLDQLRTLVCFDPIPTTAFVIREASDFIGPRPQTFDEWERATRPQPPPSV